MISPGRQRCWTVLYPPVHKTTWRACHDCFNRGKCRTQQQCQLTPSRMADDRQLFAIDIFSFLQPAYRLLEVFERDIDQGRRHTLKLTGSASEVDQGQCCIAVRRQQCRRAISFTPIRPIQNDYRGMPPLPGRHKQCSHKALLSHLYRLNTCSCKKPFDTAGGYSSTIDLYLNSHSQRCSRILRKESISLLALLHPAHRPEQAHAIHTFIAPRLWLLPAHIDNALLICRKNRIGLPSFVQFINCAGPYRQFLPWPRLRHTNTHRLINVTETVTCPSLPPSGDIKRTRASRIICQVASCSLFLLYFLQVYNEKRP